LGHGARVMGHGFKGTKLTKELEKLGERGLALVFLDPCPMPLDPVLNDPCPLPRDPVSPLSSRMILLMNLFEALPVHMGIDLCG
jgi:hypothetical protein